MKNSTPETSQPMIGRRSPTSTLNSRRRTSLSGLPTRLYRSTLGFRVIKKKKRKVKGNACSRAATRSVKMTFVVKTKQDIRLPRHLNFAHKKQPPPPLGPPPGPRPFFTAGS
jgi:hypothetical protein